MTSGVLPFHQYHRTCHLGDGSFGSVVIVYNDEGREYALKMFLEEDEREPMNLGVLREISCLRLLRSQNAHSNIIELVDVQPKAILNCEDEEDPQGAGTSHSLGITLPYYKSGSIKSAIEQNHFFSNASKKAKVAIAFGILRAVDFLHNTCGILHRDIKSDNILLEYDSHNGLWQPILIDFSLAKPFSASLWPEHTTPPMDLCLEQVEHTGEVGTMIYTAPEVMDPDSQGRYGPPMDLYSVGIVLLELLRNELFTAEKYKEIVKQVHEVKEQLTTTTQLPFPNLILQLLKDNPNCRITASEALVHSVFPKFGLHIDTANRATSKIDVATALPYQDPNLLEDADATAGTASTKENHPAVHANAKSSLNSRAKEKALHSSSRHKKYERRLKIIDKVLHELESVHPLTRSAALDYSIQMEQLDDEMDSISSSSQSLLDCCILAYRFWERDVLDFEDLQERTTGIFQSWSYEEYMDNESTIFMMLDYCLYPREILPK